MAIEIDAMVVRIVGNAKHYLRELKKAEEATKQFHTQIKSMGGGGSSSRAARARGGSVPVAKATPEAKIAGITGTAEVARREGYNWEKLHRKAVAEDKKKWEKLHQQAVNEDRKKWASLHKQAVDEQKRGEKAANRILRAEKKRELEKAQRDEQRAVQQKINWNYRQQQEALRNRERAERKFQQEQQQQVKQNQQSRREAMQGAGFGGAGAMVATGATIGGPILAFLNEAVNAFASFDHAMVQSLSILKVTGEQNVRMREEALQLATKGTAGPDELAQAYYFLGSAGLNAEQSMALLGHVQRFAQAGMIDMHKATSLATNSMNSLGLMTKDTTLLTQNLTRVTDVLVKANILADATTQQLADALNSDAGPTMRAFNRTLEEGVAALAVYANQGIKGKIAGGHLARAIRFLNEKAVENEGVFRQYGIAVFDAQGRMRNLADIMFDLEKATENLGDKSRATLLDMLGFEARMQRAILPLIGTSKQLRHFQQALENAGGTTEEVAQKQLASFTNQSKLMWNQLKVLSIGIGAQLIPVLALMVGLFTYALDLWNQAPALLKAIAAYTLVAAAAMAVLVGAIGAAILAALVLNSTIGGVGILIGIVVTLWSTYAVAAAGAFGAVVGAVLYLTDAVHLAKEGAKALWRWILPVRNALSSLGETLGFLSREVFRLFVQELKLMFNMFLTANDHTSVFEDAMFGVAAVIYFIEYTLLNFEKVWQTTWLTLGATASTLAQIFIVSFGVLAQLFLTAVINFAKNQVAIGRATTQFLIGLVNGWIRVFVQFTQQLIGILTKIPDMVAGKLSAKEAWTAAAERIKATFAGAFNEAEFKPDTKGLLEDLPEETTKQLLFLENAFGRLGATVGGMFAGINMDFTKFIEMKLKLQEGHKVRKAAAQAGKAVGEDMIKAADKELQRFDVALFRSAEAFTRFQEYMDRIKNPDLFGKGSKRFDAAKAGGAEGVDREEKQTDLLRDIRDLMKKNVDKEPVKFEEKDLG